MNTSYLIAHVQKVIDLNSEEKHYFTSLLKPQQFKKKTFVLRSGDICKSQTFVLGGCLKVFYADKDGLEHLVKFALEGWWAFDIESFLLGKPAFYDIQAVEDTMTMQLNKENYDKLLVRVPKFEKYYRTMLQDSYIMLQHRLTQNLYLDAEEKYRRFTEKYPGLETRVAQKDIASYLGITPEFLSMLRRKRIPTQVYPDHSKK
ncbi:cAMP-binding protein [Fulvivirga imtechensis AK7]|uniref:cAMP-binding protein n=1 Tax=Fulvivirga imtechensis AK7 TaxID=1237149 RepID=L8JPR6_9BACT|nr:Crp/Fnr family transcriptional regulator [Fulvivirga imtechensis]ELR69504.1 cAMP-binding protein [Fulvivirga imtechensis AK7]